VGFRGAWPAGVSRATARGGTDGDVIAAPSREEQLLRETVFAIAGECGPSHAGCQMSCTVRIQRVFTRATSAVAGALAAAVPAGRLPGGAAAADNGRIARFIAQ
jgi:hypothetical protein